MPKTILSQQEHQSSFIQKTAQYLFAALAQKGHFVYSPEAVDLYQQFLKHLQKQKATDKLQQSLKNLAHAPAEQYQMAKKWLLAFTEQTSNGLKAEFVNEAAVLLLTGAPEARHIHKTTIRKDIENLHGSHDTIKDGRYVFDYNAFLNKLERYQATVVPQFEAFAATKKELSEAYRKKLKLASFQPKVMSAFVRNKLIDQVYLPLIGDNLAKQLGTAGEGTRTDRMGLLLLISPPGYGKTTLMEYIANRLGLIFMKINGPAIGHDVTTVDPEATTNRAARQELEKLNLAFEMGDNVMIYLDDIQHCNPELLQKFISLCDAQRKIEGVWKGETKTYDFKGRRVCVVMAGNPYTESGEKFQIPDMLANRADIYNLGDIIGDTEAVFKLSYIENTLTSNPVLARLANKSMADVYALLQVAEGGSMEGLSFEGNHSPEELNEYTTVLKKLVKIRDVVLTVNKAYIRSAAIAEDYREEPSFRLQGSYRDMNKMAEKVVPIMNDQEVETLIMTHYESEAQTLTSGAEANLLKLKEMLGKLTTEEAQRWADIKATFRKNQNFRHMDADNPVSQVVAQMSRFSDELEGIKQVIQKGIKD
jgi:MoxR-like ATPase/putative component of toxin-antitoxin plasmid stabilization module